MSTDELTQGKSLMYVIFVDLATQGRESCSFMSDVFILTRDLSSAPFVPKTFNEGICCANMSEFTLTRGRIVVNSVGKHSQRGTK